MRVAFPFLGVLLLATLGTCAAQQGSTPAEKPKDAPPPSETAKPASGERKENPVKPTPEGLAAAKKVFGYDCAMCHGEQGDGKGDLVASMDLKGMKDWREAGALAGLSDSDLFDIIAKGKGKMVGEGDRVPPEKIWSLVNYVKSFAKKDGVEKASGETPKS